MSESKLSPGFRIMFDSDVLDHFLDRQGFVDKFVKWQVENRVAIFQSPVQIRQNNAMLIDPKRLGKLLQLNRLRELLDVNIVVPAGIILDFSELGEGSLINDCEADAFRSIVGKKRLEKAAHDAVIALTSTRSCHLLVTNDDRLAKSARRSKIPALCFPVFAEGVDAADDPISLMKRIPLK